MDTRPTTASLVETAMNRCMMCEKNIPDDDPFVVVSYQIERVRAPGPAPDGGELRMHVIEYVQSILVACESCGPTQGVIAQMLRDAGYPIPTGWTDPPNSPTAHD